MLDFGTDFESIIADMLSILFTFNSSSPLTSDRGFLLQKEMKTGSSTVSGVAIRIALNMARRLGKTYNICKSRFDHTYAYKMDFAKRDKKKSFLWTIIREPNSRAASSFFHFKVSVSFVVSV